MKLTHYLLIIVFLQFATQLAAQNVPQIGYVYPSGGQRGTTFQILVGGRQIARANDAIVSGEGVHAKIVGGHQGIFINNRDETAVFRWLYNKARGITNSPTVPADKDGKENPIKPEDVIQKYLYLDRLEKATDDDLQLIYYQYLSPRLEKQPKETLTQAVLVEITIDANAECGFRDLRLMTNAGLSQPARFVVGTLPETREFEPNDFNAPPLEQFQAWGERAVNLVPKNLRLQETYSVPIVFNGQILAADIDCFTFRAAQGQKLVIATEARSLLPYLADAVPGWFQAMLTLYDSDGNTLAQAASYQFDADPVLLVEIPKDGEYRLEIRDTIFRGREDFVYRVSVAESPFITSAFPLGRQVGASQSLPAELSPAKLDGWNLPAKTVSYPAGEKPNGTELRTLNLLKGKPLLEPIRYAVDTLNEMIESEPNNVWQKANAVKLPTIINGRIDAANDADVYLFHAKKGEKIVFDVAALSLGSPVDTSLEIIDAGGKVLASNDDRADSSGPNIGLETHHADPYLIFESPEDADYAARIFGAFESGASPPSYRLRISPPRYDIEAYCEPASITFTGKNTQSVKFHVFRKDGFAGKVTIRLPKELSDWKLDNAVISAKETQTTAVLTAPPSLGKTPIAITFEAVAETENSETETSDTETKTSDNSSKESQKIIRRVIPVIDKEQAFIYHHLLPAQTLLAVRTYNPNNNARRNNQK